VVEPDGKLTQLRLASDVGLYDRFSESVDPKDFILAQPDESFRAEADDDGFVNVWWTPGKAYAKEYPGIWKLYKGRQMVQQRAYPEDMPKEFLQKAARLVQQFLRVQDVATPFMPSTSDFWGQFRNWYLASDLQVRRDLEHKLALLRHGQPVQETAKDFIMAQPAPRYVIVNDDGAYYYRFGRHVEFHIGYYPDFENVKHAIFSEQQLPNELENAKRYCPSAKPEIWIEDRGQSFQGPAVPPHEVDEAIDPKDFITTQEAPGVWYAVSAMIDGQQCYFKTDGFRCNTSPGLYTADAAQGIADDYEAWLRGEGEPLRHRAYEKSATDIKVVPAQTDLPEAIDPKDFIMGLPGIKSVAEEYGLPMVEEHLHTPGTGGKPGTTEEWMERAGYVRYQRFTGSMPLPVPVNRWDSEHHRIESLEVSVLYWESKPGWTLYPHQLRIDIHGRSKKMSHESEHGLASNLEFRLRRLRDTLARMRVGKHTRLERVLASLGYKSL
jgi:hypothetical protein